MASEPDPSITVNTEKIDGLKIWFTIKNADRRNFCQSETKATAQILQLKRVSSKVWKNISNISWTNSNSAIIAIVIIFMKLINLNKCAEFLDLSQISIIENPLFANSTDQTVESSSYTGKNDYAREYPGGLKLFLTAEYQNNPSFRIFNGERELKFRGEDATLGLRSSKYLASNYQFFIPGTLNIYMNFITVLGAVVSIETPVITSTNTTPVGFIAACAFDEDRSTAFWGAAGPGPLHKFSYSGTTVETPIATLTPYMAMNHMFLATFRFNKSYFIAMNSIMTGSNDWMAAYIDVTNFAGVIPGTFRVGWWSNSSYFDEARNSMALVLSNGGTISLIYENFSYTFKYYVAYTGVLQTNDITPVFELDYYLIAGTNMKFLLVFKENMTLSTSLVNPTNSPSYWFTQLWKNDTGYYISLRHSSLDKISFYTFVPEIRWITRVNDIWVKWDTGYYFNSTAAFNTWYLPEEFPPGYGPNLINLRMVAWSVVGWLECLGSYSVWTKWGTNLYLKIAGTITTCIDQASFPVKFGADNSTWILTAWQDPNWNVWKNDYKLWDSWATNYYRNSTSENNTCNTKAQFPDGFGPDATNTLLMACSASNWKTWLATYLLCEVWNDTYFRNMTTTGNKWVLKSEFPITYGADIVNNVMKGCQVALCLECLDEYRNWTSWPTGYYKNSEAIGNTWITKAQFTAKNGINLLNSVMTPCFDSNCSVWLDNYRLCTLWNTNYYRSNTSENNTWWTTLQFPIAFGADNANNLVVPCRDSLWDKWSTDYMICEIWPRHHYKSSTDPNVAVCIKKEDFAPAHGVDEVNNLMAPCVLAGWGVCIDDYNVCQRCQKDSYFKIEDPNGEVCYQNNIQGMGVKSGDSRFITNWDNSDWNDWFLVNTECMACKPGYFMIEINNTYTWSENNITGYGMDLNNPGWISPCQSKLCTEWYTNIQKWEVCKPVWKDWKIGFCNVGGVCKPPKEPEKILSKVSFIKPLAKVILTFSYQIDDDDFKDLITVKARNKNGAMAGTIKVKSASKTDLSGGLPLPGAGYDPWDFIKRRILYADDDTDTTSTDSTSDSTAISSVLTLELDIRENLNSAILIIANKPGKLAFRNDIGALISDIEIKDVSYVDKSGNAAMAAMEKTSPTGQAAAMALNVFGILQLSSPNPAALLKLGNSLEYLTMLNGDYPLLSNIMIEFLNPQMSLPFKVNWPKIDESLISCDPAENFQRNEMSCQFFNNTSDWIIVTSMLGLLWAFFTILVYLIKLMILKKIEMAPPKIHLGILSKIALIVNKKFNIALFLAVFEGDHMGLFLPMVLNLHAFNGSRGMISGLVVAILYFILYGAFIVWLFIHISSVVMIYKLKMNKKNSKTKRLAKKNQMMNAILNPAQIGNKAEGSEDHILGNNNNRISIPNLAKYDEKDENPEFWDENAVNQHSDCDNDINQNEDNNDESENNQVGDSDQNIVNGDTNDEKNNMQLEQNDDASFKLDDQGDDNQKEKIEHPSEFTNNNLMEDNKIHKNDEEIGNVQNEVINEKEPSGADWINIDNHIEIDNQTENNCQDNAKVEEKKEEEIKENREAEENVEEKSKEMCIPDEDPDFELFPMKDTPRNVNSNSSPIIRKKLKLNVKDMSNKSSLLRLSKYKGMAKTPARRDKEEQMPSVIIKKVQKSEKQHNKEKYESLVKCAFMKSIVHPFKDFTKINLGVYTPLITMIKNLLVMIFLVLYAEQGAIQIILILSIEMLYFVYISYFRPYEDKSDNFIAWYTAFGFTLFLAIYLYIFTMRQNMPFAFFEMHFGIALWWIIIVIVGANLYPAVNGIYLAISGLVIQLINWCNKSKRKERKERLALEKMTREEERQINTDRAAKGLLILHNIGDAMLKQLELRDSAFDLDATKLKKQKSAIEKLIIGQN